MKAFQVALTADFYNAAGEPNYADLGLEVFEAHPHINVRCFSEHRSQIGADQLMGANGVVVLTPAVTNKTVASAAELLAIGRFGVGYDAVDVAACTAADVLVYITAGAVDRSVAEATIGWMIGISHQFRAKDRLLREGKWSERSHYMGSELRDRTLGIIGLGGIARKVLELLTGWGMKSPLAFDPYADPAVAAKFDVRLVELDDLLRHSDFVSVHCPLTEQTRGLIGNRELALMKSSAYFINTARGGIVDESALYDALKHGRIAGAALDCFANEPITEPHRFGELENVLLAPHSIAWTNELFRDIGRAACQGMVDLSLKRRPRGVINPEVFHRAGFQRKWDRLSPRIND